MKAQTTVLTVVTMFMETIYGGLDPDHKPSLWKTDSDIQFYRVGIAFVLMFILYV